MLNTVFRASACKIRLNEAQCLVIKHSVPIPKFTNVFRRQKKKKQNLSTL